MIIVTLKNEGYTNTQIQQKLLEKYRCNVSIRTITRTFTRYKTTGSVLDYQRSGRPKVCSPREERQVRRMALKNRQLSTRRIAGSTSELLGHSISARTVSRILRKFGLRRRIMARVPFLTKIQKSKRLAWARKLFKWPIAQWSRVVFSDEKIFRVTSNRHGSYVTRFSTEKYSEYCISRSPKSGPQIHVWGSIGWQNIGPLKRVVGNLNAVQYQQQILNDIENLGNRCVGYLKPWIFMQDGAPAHRANTTRQFLANRHVRLLDWPGNSPDANPIEHVWSYLTSQLPPSLPKNENELLDRVHTAWLRIPQSYINNLFRSMRKRLLAIIAARGGHTRY